MACGIGICFSCVVKVRQPDGEWDYKRTCVEGPDLRGGEDRVVSDARVAATRPPTRRRVRRTADYSHKHATHRPQAQKTPASDQGLPMIAPIKAN